MLDAFDGVRKGREWGGTIARVHCKYGTEESCCEHANCGRFFVHLAVGMLGEGGESGTDEGQSNCDDTQRTRGVYSGAGIWFVYVRRAVVADVIEMCPGVPSFPQPSSKHC